MHLIFYKIILDIENFFWLYTICWKRNPCYLIADNSSYGDLFETLPEYECTGANPEATPRRKNAWLSFTPNHGRTHNKRYLPQLT